TAFCPTARPECWAHPSTCALGADVEFVVLLRNPVQCHRFALCAAMRKLKLAALGVGLATIASVLALAGPASQLFSLHMSQHLLLIAVAAPLPVLGGIDIPVPPLAGWIIFVGLFPFWHWASAFQWAALHP